MFSAAAVLVCALDVIGRPINTFPPIQFVGVAPPEASQHVEAFVRPGSGVISIVVSAPAFRGARESECMHRDDVVKVASVIIHEEWHVRHGADERGAYEAQLAALMRFGVQPGSALHYGVVRAMLKVIDAPAAREPDIMAARFR